MLVHGIALAKDWSSVPPQPVLSYVATFIVQPALPFASAQIGQALHATLADVPTSVRFENPVGHATSPPP